MKRNVFEEKVKFCHFIQHWYWAEDEPGISATDRCFARLSLGSWLLNNFAFNRFPPPGSHIQGIPNVMFEDWMTNVYSFLVLIRKVLIT